MPRVAADSAPSKPFDWQIEPLAKRHIRHRFDCGEPALDEYLAHFARQNHESGIARTFVAVSKIEPALVRGYYSLVVGSIDRSHLPGGASRRFPNFPIPIARLARLAVDESAKGSGLGKYLLMDALAHCLDASKKIGIVAVLVEAKHDRARRFYEHYEFEPLADHPLTLWLPIREIRRILEP